MIKLTYYTKDIKKNCFKTRILVLTFIIRRDHHGRFYKTNNYVHLNYIIDIL